MALNLTADGDTEVEVPIGAEFSFAPTGTWGSGTLKLQYRCNGAWVDFTDSTASATADGTETILTNIGDAAFINVNLSGSTSPDLDVPINVLPRP